MKPKVVEPETPVQRDHCDPHSCAVKRWTQAPLKVRALSKVICLFRTPGLFAHKIQVELNCQTFFYFSFKLFRFLVTVLSVQHSIFSIESWQATWLYSTHTRTWTAPAVAVRSNMPCIICNSNMIPGNSVPIFSHWNSVSLTRCKPANGLHGPWFTCNDLMADNQISWIINFSRLPSYRNGSH